MNWTISRPFDARYSIVWDVQLNSSKIVLLNNDRQMIRSFFFICRESFLIRSFLIDWRLFKLKFLNSIEKNRMNFYQLTKTNSRIKFTDLIDNLFFMIKSFWSNLFWRNQMTTLGQHLVSKILAKIQGTEKLTDLKNLGTR